MRQSEVLVVIPARGGSKGIPRKNLRIVGGKPLLAHTILQARGASEVSRVVVSTDDAEIAAVAQEYGAEAVERPRAISGDEASSESALIHVLDVLAQGESYTPDLVVMLQCTSPLRQSADVDGAIRILREEQADSLLSVVPFHLSIWQKVNGEVTALDYDPRSRPRRQDRSPEYMENGSIYVFRPWVLREYGSRLGGKVALHVMDEWSALDINDPRDLELAEWFLAKEQSTRPELSEGQG